MKAWALIGLLILSGSAGAQQQQTRGRGWLTGVGLGIAGGGAVTLAMAAYQAAQAEAASFGVAAYYRAGAAPTASEASSVRWLQRRSEDASQQSLLLLISGAAALGVGAALVVLDGLWGTASMTVAIQPTGASVVLTGRF